MTQPSTAQFSARHRLPAVLLSAVLLAVGASGCIRSRVIVTSDPPGATVTMNELNLGATPVEMPFTWFWYYDFTAEKDGFQSAEVRRKFRAPFYMYPPFDLILEAMPFPIYETQRVHFDLVPEEGLPPPSYVQN